MHTGINMSLGYVKGKYWVTDDHFARYAKWDTYRDILPALRHEGYAVDISFTYISRSYQAEIISYEKRPWGYLRHSRSLAYDPNPMAAMTKAIRKLDRPGALLLAYCLELEVQLLAETYAIAHARELLLERLDFQLDVLNDLLPAVRKFLPCVEPLSGDPSDVAAAHWESIQQGSIDYPEPIHVYDEDDDL